MDQENRFFTQSIVGTPRRLPLGVLSRLTQQPGFSFARAETGPVAKSPVKLAVFLKWPLQHFTRWRAIAVASLAGAAAMWLVVLNHDAGESGATMPNQYAVRDDVARPPYVPRVDQTPPLSEQPPGSIVIESTPFPAVTPGSPPIEEVKKDAETSAPRESPLPIAPAGSVPEQSALALAEKTVTPPTVAIQKVPPSKTAEPARQVEHGHRVPSKLAKENTEKRDKEPPPKAVILDTTRAPDPSKPTTPASQAPSMQPDAKGKNLVGPTREVTAGLVGAPNGGTEVKVTVVDIAPDNSFVLISNPQTRLPQKFVVGQTIFTGETIQKIDAEKGQVKLNGRSIGMR